MDQTTPTRDLDKARKFRELAEARVSATIWRIRQIGKLARRTSYAFNQEQLEAIFKALRDEVDAAEKAFAPPPPKEKFGRQHTLFKLED